MNKIVGVTLDDYAENLEAIVINPPWSGNFGMDEFKGIKIPLSKMKEGLIFVWAEKEYISDIVYYFENQGIRYVENVVWIMLDPECKGNKVLNPRKMLEQR